MLPSQAFALHRDAIRNLVQRFRVSNPRVFGSVLHGTDTEDSDLDLLVDPQPGATLFDLGGLQWELKELMGVRVDVRTPKDLPDYFRDTVWPKPSRSDLRGRKSDRRARLPGQRAGPDCVEGRCCGAHRSGGH